MMIVLHILLGVVLLCILVVVLAVDTRVDITKPPNSIGAQAALMADSELVRLARR
jgi:prolyl-tRNA editing enzyme YbaK/EbsC (Cys-tRNA(Pro) deacylase)